MPLDDGLPKQDSLRGLASVDVEKDFPDLEYASFRNALGLRLICPIRMILSHLPKQNPHLRLLLGIAMISILSAGAYIAIRGLTD